MSLQQVSEQVNGVLPGGLVFTVHQDVEQQLKDLIDVPSAHQLVTGTHYSHDSTQYHLITLT